MFIQIDLYDARTGETMPSTENIIRTGESFGVRDEVDDNDDDDTDAVDGGSGDTGDADG